MWNLLSDLCFCQNLFLLTFSFRYLLVFLLILFPLSCSHYLSIWNVWDRKEKQLHAMSIFFFFFYSSCFCGKLIKSCTGEKPLILPPWQKAWEKGKISHCVLTVAGLLNFMWKLESVSSPPEIFCCQSWEAKSWLLQNQWQKCILISLGPRFQCRHIELRNY